MSGNIDMDDKTILARIDLLGLGVADTAKYIDDDNIIWDMNQATIALESAFRRLSKRIQNGHEGS